MTPSLATAPSETLAGFAALLRDHGLSVGIAEQQAMLNAALVLGPMKEQRLRAAWRAIACHNAREWRLWPELFDRYWHPHRLRGGVRVSGQTRPSRDIRQAVQQMHEQLDAAAQPPIGQSKPSAQTAADQPGLAESELDNGSTPKAQGGASRTEPLQQRDGQMWLPQELGALQLLARQITARLKPLPTRRWRSAKPGRRLDLRQTNEFARVHARAQLRRGARVWVMSDGFDTDEPEHLAAALQSLRGHGARITWFHPTRHIPAAAALQGARSQIHRFIPLASMADLAAARHVLQ